MITQEQLNSWADKTVPMKTDLSNMPPRRSARSENYQGYKFSRDILLSRCSLLKDLKFEAMEPLLLLGLMK